MKMLKIFYVLFFIGLSQAFMITGKMNEQINHDNKQFMNDLQNLHQLDQKELQVQITPKNYKFQQPDLEKQNQQKTQQRKLENQLQEEQTAQESMPQDDEQFSSNPFTENVSNLDVLETQNNSGSQQQQAQTGNKDLDNMIQKALKATNYKSPIIVINHAPKIHYKSLVNNNTSYSDSTPVSKNAQTFEDSYQQFKDDQLLSKQPMVLKKWHDPNPGQVKFMELTTLIDISNSVWEYYNTYFSKVPKTNGTASGLDQAVDALRFYKDTKELVQMVFNEREQLKEDLYYLDMKINLMQADRFFMVEFYGFSYKYQQMQNTLSSMKEDTRKKIGQDLEIENQRLDNIANQFSTDVKTLHAKIYELQKLNGFFEREISEIQTADNENKIANALEKFDRILILTLRILEMKQTIEDSVQQIREKTQNLSTYRSQVESVILDMSQIEQKVKLKEEMEKKREEEEAAAQAEKEKKYLKLLGTFSLTLLLFQLQY